MDDKVVGLYLLPKNLNEIMRLFVVAPTITKVVKNDSYLGDLFIPQGLSVELAIQVMHKDPKYWHEDVTEFSLGRFVDDILKACTPPHLFVRYVMSATKSHHHKLCHGQNKILMSMMLNRIEFLPSPKYKHHP